MSDNLLTAPFITPEAFGAKGDGVTDDTAAITWADSWARSHGNMTVRFGAKVYMASQLVIYSGTNWVGQGRGAPISTTAFAQPTEGTVLRQIVGSNVDFLYGQNSAQNWGSSSPVAFPDGFRLEGLQIDGNWNAGAGNTSGSGLVFFGDKPLIRDVYICNCAQYGMRTGWIISNSVGSPGFGTWTMEGYYENIKIDTVGEHGWWEAGPHDSTVIGCIIVDASRSAHNTYDCFYVDSGSSNTWIACHGWTRHATAGGASVWARYSLNYTAGAGAGRFCSGCQFEGAYSACANIAGSGAIFDSTTLFYGAGNGTSVILSGSGNRFCQPSIGAPASGAPAAASIDFAGSNSNIVHVYSPYPYSGTPAPSDDVRINSGAFVHASVLVADGPSATSGVGIDVLSISVGPGTWELWGSVGFETTGTFVNWLSAGISTTSATFEKGITGLVRSVTTSGTVGGPIDAGRAIVYFPSATTVYLVATCQFSGGTAVVGGELNANPIY